MATSRSTAWLLAWAWVALIVYASLFPFAGWTWPPSLSSWAPLRLPWPGYFIAFDIVSNLLGYAPLGFLLLLARWRHGTARGVALVGAVVAGSALSYALEVLQQFMPTRVPSALDWLLNSAGTALGALLAGAAVAGGLPRRWDALRDRWIEHGNGGALALLLLWPPALLFPPPVPLALGQVGPALSLRATGWIADVPWAEGLLPWLDALATPAAPLSPQADSMMLALGLLSPCLLAFAASAPGVRRIKLVAGATTLGLAATTLSAALSFGPEHALAWANAPHLAACVVAALLALALMWTPPRLAGGLALVGLTGLVLLVHQAPSDPYIAHNLQAWEQGRFIRFHGLAQWLGWLWPYAAMAWLLGRLARH